MDEKNYPGKSFGGKEESKPLDGPKDMPKMPHKGMTKRRKKRSMKRKTYRGL